jgi:hypothetical protein
MEFMPTTNQASVYQLHIWLKGISPMIWRRILIKDDSTVADLHYAIQILMDWEDYNLHQFTIHSKTIGIARVGGLSLIDANKVFLRDFKFTINERFLYEYSFYEYWEHEIRVEKLLPINPKIIYPCCIDGKRAPPPECCGGPNAFMELQDHYSPWEIEKQLISLARHRLHTQNDDEEDEDLDDDDAEELLETLTYWINRHKLNRRAINLRLQEHFKSEKIMQESTNIKEAVYEG